MEIMDVQSLTDEQFYKRLCAHISKIYQRDDVDDIARLLLSEFNNLHSKIHLESINSPSLTWDEKDIYLITYGDSIYSDGVAPLQVLYKFLMKYMKSVVNTIHVLPFFPYSSDRGFSIINYEEVNKELGSWNDINKITKQFRLMADLVVNHISSKSNWFQQYLKGEKPGCDYFIEADEEDDLSQVVRPRTSPLLKQVNTSRGKKYIWCTFSFDQIDLNFFKSSSLVRNYSNTALLFGKKCTCHTARCNCILMEENWNLMY